MQSVLNSKLLEHFAACLKAPLPATGRTPGFSATADGGTVFSHHGEYNRVKTLIRGRPVSTATHYQDFNRTEGDTASFDNADGLTAAKAVMMQEKLKLDKDFISENFVGFSGDGKYLKWGVPPKMRELFKLGPWGNFDIGDPAHLIERVDKLVCAFDHNSANISDSDLYRLTFIANGTSVFCWVPKKRSRTSDILRHGNPMWRTN